jgi:hypothetical protein
MIHVPQGARFVDLYWYAPDLVLNTTYSWKPYVTKIQAVRATALGFDTNSGANLFQSLTVLKTGRQYLLDLKNIPSIGLDIDNGVPPSNGTNILIRQIPDTLPHTVTYKLDTFPFSLGVPVFKNGSGGVLPTQGTLMVQLDGGVLVTPTTFNTQIAAIPQSEYESNLHSYTLTYQSGTPGRVEIPVN